MVDLGWCLCVLLPALALLLLCLVVVIGHHRLRKTYEPFAWEKADFHYIYGTLHKYPGPNEAGLAFQREHTAKNPRISILWVGPLKPLIILHHPEVIKDVIISEPKSVVGTNYAFGMDWLGEGLLLSTGKKWKRNRKLLTPAFHFNVLKPYIHIYNTAADILMNKIDEYVARGESFELFTLISMCTMDILLRCAFSHNSQCQLYGESDPYIKAVNKLNDLWVERTLYLPFFFDFIFKLSKSGRQLKKNCQLVHSMAEELIRKRMATLEKGVLPKRYLDFLDILLSAKDEDGEGLSFSEIRNEVDTFLFEGHDTTTSSLCWILCSLAEHQQYQNKVQEELDQIFVGKKEEFIGWEDIPKLQYTTLCIKEGMRLHSPVHQIERKASKDVKIDGYFVPAGTHFIISIYNLHHNPSVWEDPMDYIPERFLLENYKSKHPLSFIPFSAGERNCIGQHFAMNEQKLLLGRILHKYNIKLDPNFKVEKKIGVVMKSENGIWVTATPRQISHK